MLPTPKEGLEVVGLVEWMIYKESGITVARKIVAQVRAIVWYSTRKT